MNITAGSLYNLFGQGYAYAACISQLTPSLPQAVTRARPASQVYQRFGSVPSLTQQQRPTLSLSAHDVQHIAELTGMIWLPAETTTSNTSRKQTRQRCNQRSNGEQLNTPLLPRHPYRLTIQSTNNTKVTNQGLWSAFQGVRLLAVCVRLFLKQSKAHPSRPLRRQPSQREQQKWRGLGVRASAGEAS